jgi:hypothetical protein
LENSLVVTKKRLNIKLPHDSAIPFPGVHSKELTEIQIDIYIPMFISSTIHKSQNVEITQMSTNNELKKIIV